MIFNIFKEILNKLQGDVESNIEGVTIPEITITDRYACFSADEIDKYIIDLLKSKKREFFALSNSERRLWALIGENRINVMHMFPAYWVNNIDGNKRKINITKTLYRLIIGGYMELCFKYEDLTIPQIKEILKSGSIAFKSKDKKEELIYVLKSNFTYDELFNNPLTPKRFCPSEKYYNLYLSERKKFNDEFKKFTEWQRK